jgi:hypothetical protein
MANYQVSIAIDDVITALGNFLAPFVAPAVIVRAQVNRVPPPVTSFVMLTELHIIDLETPIAAWDADTATLTGPAQIDVQVDFYGPASGDQCKAVKGIYRSNYATSQFPDGIKPLYCSDGNQSPLVTGEEQYESRWTLTASLQYNPSVAIPQQTANELAMAVVQEI